MSSGRGTCEECGGAVLRPASVEGNAVLVCDLCGALHGDEGAVRAALRNREGRERGFEPAVYPLVLALDKLAGLRVIRAHAGDTEERVWPFVQMRILDGRALIGLENLAKSLALAAVGSGQHWVVEAEYAAQLTVTLKPRFHRDPDRIDAAAIAAAQRDLGRLAANLERDMRLSWWRR